MEHHPQPSAHSDQIERWRDALVELNIRAWLIAQGHMPPVGRPITGLTLDEFTAHITAHPLEHHDNPAVSEMLVSWVLGSHHPPHDGHPQ